MNLSKRKKVYRASKGKCFYCRTKIDFEECHIDHVVPKSKGGKDNIDNLVAACIRCNLMKGDLSVLKFILKVDSKKQEAIELINHCNKILFDKTKFYGKT